MKLFSEILKTLREARHYSVSDLGDLISIPTATLYAYEARRRSVPQDKATLLRQALCTSELQLAEFDEAYIATGQVRAAMQEKFGSSTATLFVADLQYAPFSGSAEFFCNKFLEGILNPAVIRIERPPTLLLSEAQSSESFSMQERMRSIEEGDADIIINLQNPMRMRKLKFLLMPIRVSLNGVILMHDIEDLREARKQLVAGDEDPKRTFNLMAVQNEVGHVFLQHTRNVAIDKIEMANTLDARKLADLLQPDSRKMLVCDEITALAVVAAKDGSATLVLPPSTDQSIMHFEMRRRLPVHYLGFGILRQNEELIDFLEEALQNFVSTEVETVAELLETLYHGLVKQVRESFERNRFLYSGGIRRVSKYPNAPLGEGVARAQDSGLHLSFQTDVINTLVTQSARAFARRTLNISKRSVTEGSDELWNWRNVLRRSRQRVLIAEARDRANVREIIISCMKSVLGIDPVSSFEESYRRYFQDAIDPEHFPDFRESLERELDVTFPPTLDPMHAEKGRAFWIPAGMLSSTPFNHLEWFVSAVQRAMEANTEAARLVTVKQLSASRGSLTKEVERDGPQESWENTFTTLWKEYCLEVGKNPDLVHSRQRVTRLVAFSLGQAVGFVKATNFKFRGQPAIQVQDMYVTEIMRKSGISRRLIRALIETAVSVPSDRAKSSSECVYVWISAGFRDDVNFAFEKSGFRKSRQDNAYFYRLYGLEKTDLQRLDITSRKTIPRPRQSTH